MIDAYTLQGAQNLIYFTKSISLGHATHSTMKIAYLWCGDSVTAGVSAHFNTLHLQQQLQIQSGSPN
jgi:hypothetical protein